MIETFLLALGAFLLVCGLILAVVIVSINWEHRKRDDHPGCDVDPETLTWKRSTKGGGEMRICLKCAQSIKLRQNLKELLK